MSPCAAVEPARPPPGTSENPGRSNSECRAKEWPGDVDPVAREVGADEVGAEGAGRVHRSARDRTAPQAREGDVRADPDRAEDPDVLCARCRAEDDADEPQGEHGLHQERVSGREAGGGIVRAIRRRDADHPPQEETRERRARQLDNDIPGNATPGKVFAQRERDADRRVQMGARHLAHEHDDRHHHQPRRDHRRRSADGVRERLPHHPGARSDKNQEERPQQLRKESPPPLAWIVEVLQGVGEFPIELCQHTRSTRRCLRPLRGGFLGCRGWFRRSLVVASASSTGASSSTGVSAAQPARWVIQIAYRDMKPTNQSTSRRIDPDDGAGGEPQHGRPVVERSARLGAGSLDSPFTGEPSVHNAASCSALVRNANARRKPPHDAPGGRIAVNAVFPERPRPKRPHGLLVWRDHSFRLRTVAERRRADPANQGLLSRPASRRPVVWRAWRQSPRHRTQTTRRSRRGAA